jgi:hypothetical protein
MTPTAEGATETLAKRWKELVETDRGESHENGITYWSLTPEKELVEQTIKTLEALETTEAKRDARLAEWIKSFPIDSDFDREPNQNMRTGMVAGALLMKRKLLDALDATADTVSVAMDYLKRTAPTALSDIAILDKAGTILDDLLSELEDGPA